MSFEWFIHDWHYSPQLYIPPEIIGKTIMSTITTAMLMLVVLTAVFVALIVVVRFYAKRRLGQLQANPSLSSEYDRAYSEVMLAENLANRLKSKGLVGEDLEKLLIGARFALNAGKYERAISYARTAREVMMVKEREYKEGVQSVKVPAEDNAGDIAKKVEEEAKHGDRGVGAKPAVDLLALSGEAGDEGIEDVRRFTEFNLEDYVKKRDNKMPARFTIVLAEEAIAKAKKDGCDVEVAIKLLKLAKKALNAEDYTTALSYAYKSKKAAEGYDIDISGIDLGEAGAEEHEAESGEEYEEVYVCPQCNAEVEYGDKFCWNCGARLEFEIICQKCGAKIREGDKFCRNCGARVIISK